MRKLYELSGFTLPITLVMVGLSPSAVGAGEHQGRGMTDYLWQETTLERMINGLNQQIVALKEESVKIKVAANFLLCSIVDVLDQQGGDEKFSKALITTDFQHKYRRR